MSRRLDIGICAFKDAHKLAKAVSHLRQNSTTDWRLLIVDNPAEGSDTRPYIERLMADEPRVTAKFMPENVGYAGAVNEILAWAETEYVAYLDHDAYVMTPGWDEVLCEKLDGFHEIGLIFPNGGAYPIQRGEYTEVLWQAGFCWIINRLCMADVKSDGKTERGEVMDTTLGHQEEADLAERVRMAGWKCAAIPAIQVQHDASSTNSPASNERIGRGVQKWVDKHNAYYNGKLYHYSHPWVTRFENWPPNQLYLEEYFRKYLPPDWNANPEQMTINGQAWDVIKVLRWPKLYRDRRQV